MLSDFFLKRPIFAWVIAIIIMLYGGLAIYQLPIQNYPKIAPTTISVSTSYPGATAAVVEQSVTQIIEEQLTGLDHMRNISSTSDSAGNVSISVDFEPEADADIAEVQVQNVVQAILGRLPEQVQAGGVRVNKVAKSFLCVLAFVSEDGSMNESQIGDFITNTVQDPISRVNGVGSITFFGKQYAMRVWLDPHKLFKYSLTPSDVVNSIRSQNMEISFGQLGGLPSTAEQKLDVTVTSKTGLESIEDFEKVLLVAQTDGSLVYLKDVARIELGANTYGTINRYNKMPAAGLGIKLSPGANELDTARDVDATIERLRPFFPKGLAVEKPYDTTPFVQNSILEVIKTLFEAFILVFLIMYLFLQNFRATLIPTIAIPIVFCGTFAILHASGFSANTLTMLALILAIGLLVDDAIVVVENVERCMEEEGLSPMEATKKSMRQISGALIGIGMVLAAVFLPMAFFKGATGNMYRQFSIAIVSSMGLSVIVALFFTPVLCANLLQPKGTDHKESAFFKWFNGFFERTKSQYLKTVDASYHKKIRYGLVYLGIIAVLIMLFFRLPTSFVPDEDQGILFIQVMTPVGTTQSTTLETLKKIEAYFLEEEKESVQGVFTITGFNFSGTGQNAGLAFVSLKNWDERRDSRQRVSSIVQRAQGIFSNYKDSLVFALVPPAIKELGNASGYNFFLTDQGGLGHQKLLEARNQLFGLTAKNKIIQGLRPNGMEDVAQYQLIVARDKALSLGVPLQDLYTDISLIWSGKYIDDFLFRNKIKQIYVQSDAPYRMMPQDLDVWYERNTKGQMVPLSSLCSGKWIFGPQRLERFNGVSGMEMAGSTIVGASTGAAMDFIEECTKKLPKGIGCEWVGLSYEERLAGSQAPKLYAVSVIFIFLCLAALYESWTIPLAILLIFPLGVMGALVGANLCGLANDVYLQVSILTTIGLSAKNGILIIAFARDLQKQGHSLYEATLMAAKQRFRPILMTSLAFVLGVTPLVLHRGEAGSGSQNVLGTGVIGGMVGATFLALIFIPVIYWIVGAFSAGKEAAIDSKIE